MNRIALLVSLTCLATAPTWAQFSHFTGYVGGGFTQPVNPIARRLDPGWNIAAGVGTNVNTHFGINLDFMYNQMGINSSFLNQAGAPDGNVHVWGFTLDPVIHVAEDGPVDFYITGGGGIYNRTVEYTQPGVSTGLFFDPWFGYYPAAFGTNQVLGSFSQYKAGVDGGAGFSVRLGPSRVKAFAEARYHHIFTRNVATDIIPVTFGLRW